MRLERYNTHGVYQRIVCGEDRPQDGALDVCKLEMMPSVEIGPKCPSQRA